MKPFASIAVLVLVAALAQAGTFELSDPANEMLQEEQDRKTAQPAGDASAAVPLSLGDTLCTVDTSTGACSCIDKKMARKMSLSQDQCAARVLQALKLQQP